MKMNILAAAAGLSDRDLLARLDVLARKEREALVELLAHLAALDSRPSVYAGQGFGSLFSYCTQALRFSEDAACNRIEAARACRRFPVILDRLASGEVTLTAVRLLSRHLTPDNHQSVLARAKGRTRAQIDCLLAELAPRPDVPTSIHRLPTFTPPSSAAPNPVMTEVPAESRFQVSTPLPASVATSRPIVQATAPERYRVQFTIGQETHDKLRRVQELLRREIPTGDPGVIFDRAISLLLETVERSKLGAAKKPRPRTVIRPGTDNSVRKLARRSRYIPREVKRAVWRRDGGQCAYRAPSGQRCPERRYLEFHHVQAYAQDGPATVENIFLHCRLHNRYQAEIAFGPDWVRSCSVRAPDP